MTEAWLLSEERAIRVAAGNPNGTMDLDLPEPRRIEALPDPKAVLHELLERASGLRSPRRLARFRRSRGARVRIVAAQTRDFGSLRALPSFRAFEEELRHGLAEAGLFG